MDPVLLKVMQEIGGPEVSLEALVSLSEPSRPDSAPQAFTIGETCQLSQWIQWTLQNDPSVFSALSAIPREGRSLANAIMLWDGDWVASDVMTAEVTDPIRAAIVIGVESAPVDCIDQPIQGPIFLPIQDDFGTTLVAVGSGTWQWADLLTSTGQQWLPGPKLGNYSQ